MNIENRTEPQIEAIETNHPRVLVLAGPGSGKTDTLAARIARLVNKGIDPGKIVAITYTNEAARNLEDRLVCPNCHGAGWTVEPDRHGDPEQVQCPCGGKLRLGFAGTLHGYALRMLRQHGESLGYGPTLAVIDADAADELLVAKARAMKCKASIRDLVKFKAEGRPTGPIFTPTDLAVVAYLTELHENGLIDFDSILTEFRRLLERRLTISLERGVEYCAGSEFDYLFVDEVQDSAAIDWSIFQALPIANKFYVGDPDQAIFGFRGGRPDLMTTLARDRDTKVLYLEANFRCAPEICQAANKLIAHNSSRIPKDTIAAPSAPAGICQAYGFVPLMPVFGNEGEEIAAVVRTIKVRLQGSDLCEPDIPPQTFAILSRTNAIATEFREALRAAGISVEEPAAPTAPPDWGVARALIELLANPFNDVLAYFYFAAREERKGASRAAAVQKAQDIRREAAAAGKALNAIWLGFPADSSLEDVGRLLDRDGVCRETRALVQEIVKTLPSGSGPADLALEVARHDRKTPAAPSVGIFCGSIHAAKGREWDQVFIVGFEDESFPGGKRADVEEERRLAFVALTRARRGVTMTWAASRRASWGYRPIEKRTPSRFIGEALT